MSEYWMLECYNFDEEGYQNVGKYPDEPPGESWSLGKRFAVPVKQPLRMEWNPNSTGERLTLYKPTIPLMSREVVQALQEAGVDNLDCYEAVIVDKTSGESDKGYLAVNVVGLVSAADLTKSDYADPSGARLIDLDFDSLAIDPGRAHGQKLFRLAECVSGIVIHKSVKEHLESKGGFGLTFVPPEKWIG